MRLAREQRVGDPIGDDFVVAILVSWLLQIEVVASSATPQWEEPLAREIPFQPRKEVIEVVYAPVRKDEQADGVELGGAASLVLPAGQQRVSRH